MVKIIAEVTYNFYANTIRRDNNVQIVTSENEKSYYCQAIGTPFKKDKENKDMSLVCEFKKLKSNLAKAIESYNSFQQKYNVSSLQDVVILEDKTTKKNEELKSLRQTLELAKTQGNNMLIDAISEMIANKEKE